MPGTRRINVLSCTPVHTAPKKDGSGDYTIYEVSALNMEGAPIDLPLRSFDDLPLGEAEYTVTPYDGGQQTTYTLGKPSGNPGARLGPKVDELRTRLDALEATVAQLQADLRAVADGRSEVPQPGRVVQPEEPEITF